MTKLSEIATEATTLDGTEKIYAVQSSTSKFGLLSTIRSWVVGLTGITGPGYISGRYYGSSQMAGSLSTANVGANTMFFVPIYIARSSVWTGVSYWATASTPNAVFGVYTNSSGVPGTLVTGTNTTAAAIVTGSTQDVAFASPVTLTPGWYFIAILTNGTVTLTATNSSGGNIGFLGRSALNTSNTSVRITGSETYATTPPATAPSVTWTDASGMIDLVLKAQ